MTNPNLIPVRRTDKNGVTRVRWVRPEATPAGRGIPSPVSVSPPPMHQNNDAIVAFAYRTHNFFEPPKLHEALDLIRQHCPETLPIAVRLLTTGCSRARNQAAQGFAEGVAQVARFLALGTVVTSEQVTLTTGMSMCIRMLAGWHVFNAVSESNTEFVSDADYREMYTAVWDTHFYGSRFGDESAGTRTELPEEHYWRGSAALRIIRLDHKDKNATDADNAFMLWAGQQDDLARVIELAKERGIDVESLSAVIGQTTIPASMREGIL